MCTKNIIKIGLSLILLTNTYLIAVVPVSEKIPATYELANTILQTHGDPGRIYLVALSPNGKFIVTLDFCFRIRVWDVIEGECVKEFNGDKYTESVAFSQDGILMATSTAFCNISVWDSITWKLIKRIGSGFYHCNGNNDEDNLKAMAFNSDKTLLAVGKFSTENSYSIELWRLADGQLVKTFNCEACAIQAITFSPDDKFIAMKDYESRIRTWNVNDGNEVTKLNGADIAIFKQWQSNNIYCKYDFPGFNESNSDQVKAGMIAFIQKARRRMELMNEISSLAQAMHPRLGAGSPAQTLSEYVLQQIYEVLNAE